MNPRSLTTLLGLCLCACMACKKSTINNDNVIKPPVDTVKTVKGVDIYVAGASTVAGSNVKVATYWKNGVMRKMNDSLSGTASSGREVVVSGNDVYLSGVRGQNIVCWKNGVEISAFAGIAGGITVDNNDVYIYGSVLSAGKTTPRYWKNGVATDPPGMSSLTGMVVKGGDIYISGGYQTTTGKLVATYWKNGVRNVLAKDTTVSSVVNFLAMYGNDLYMSGSVNAKAAYWKNGVQTDITTASASVSHTAVSNNDIYVSGSKKIPTGVSTASYWKNGIEVDVINDPAATVNSRVAAIAVFGTDIYMSGSLGNTIGYWKGATWTPFVNTTDITYFGIKLIERY